MRAIAILSVLGYHFFPQIFKGGFIGVDIFFVISGYLITKLILDALGEGTFSFRDFFSRRVRRLFPSLIIVFSVFLIYGFYVLLPHEFKNINDNIFSGSLFFANFYLYKQSGYFQPAAELIPFLHIWSLAVEEQFYICCSLALFAVYKFRIKRYLLFLILSSILISFIFHFYLFNRNASVAFYFPVSRFWEFGFGSIVAYVELNNFFRMDSSLKKLSKFLNFDVRIGFPYLGLALIIYGIICITNDSSYTPALATIPTMGTALIILSTQKQWVNNGPLSWKAPIFIGLISYPLYLIHWPLLSFFRILSPDILVVSTKLVLIVASIFFSYVIYKYVEQPIRSKKLPVRYLVLPMVLLASIAFFSSKAELLPFPVMKYNVLKQISDAAEDWKFSEILENFKYKDYDFYKMGKGGHKVLFIGDSHMQQYAPRIVRLIKGHLENNKTAIFATYGGHPPIPNLYYEDRKQLNFMPAVMEYSKDPAIKEIVIAAAWTSYLSKENHYLIKVNNIIRHLDPEQSLKVALTEFEDMVRSFIKSGKKVYILLPIPTGEEYNPSQFVKRDLFGVCEVRIPTPTKQNYMKSTSTQSNYLKKIAKKVGAIIVEPSKELCDENKCLNTFNGLFIYKDGGHLRTWFVEKHFKALDQIILKTGS